MTVYTILTEVPAVYVLYDSPFWSGAFLILIFSVSVWNGGGYYIEVFGRKCVIFLSSLPGGANRPFPIDSNESWNSSGKNSQRPRRHRPYLDVLARRSAVQPAMTDCRPWIRHRHSSTRTFHPLIVLSSRTKPYSAVLHLKRRWSPRPNLS
jgi:hypothetical protein